MLNKLTATTLFLVLLTGTVAAQSSLGIGPDAPVVAPTGFFGSILLWISQQQNAFYQSMTVALKEMRDDGSAGFVLVGLSFLYGVFHAAGPGHGKVVISSYMLANETALRRGIVLSLASSLVQAMSAIIIVSLGFLLLRGTAISMTDASRFFEVGSYALLVLFGGWLVWRKLRSVRQQKLVVAVAGHHGHAHTDGHHHDHSLDGGAEVCATCGHAHMPDIKTVQDIDSWRSGLAAALTVGIRPCSGAIIVLSFAVLNGLYAAGLMAVFVMALGTALTVSTLAVLAVTAKGAALRLSGSAVMSSRIHNGIEIAGATTLLVMGLLLLGGALAN